MGPGHPQGRHVGRTVTVGVGKGQHLLGHPTVTISVDSSSGQAMSQCTSGHLIKPGLVMVRVGQAGAKIVVRLVVVLVVKGQILTSSGETVTTAWETAWSIRLKAKIKAETVFTERNIFESMWVR